MLTCLCVKGGQQKNTPNKQAHQLQKADGLERLMNTWNVKENAQERASGASEVSP